MSYLTAPLGYTTPGLSSRVVTTSMRAASTSSMGPTPSMALGPTGCAVPASSALETVAWSTRGAPAWRHCSHGLCIEGVCNNPLCVAMGQQVICSLGFTTLDMVAPQGRSRCPCCSSIVTPANVAFNNCEWTLEGTKMEHPGAQPETVQRLQWETVGNTYAHFKPDPTDQSIWVRLSITTRRPSATVATHQPIDTNSGAQALQPPSTALTGSNQVVCSICCGEPFSRFGPTAINTPCGHCYHRACLKPWVQRGRGDCPTCRRDISCLMPELLLRS